MHWASDAWNWIAEPWQYPFMRSALIAIFLIGITCALLGSYVVLRRMAFIGDAISHTVLPGIVIAYLEGFNLFFGALFAGLLTAIGIGWLSKREAMREDTAIGVLFTGMFALGILLMTHAKSFHDFNSMLFGDILAVTNKDLILMAGITAIVLIVLALFFKELELTSVDPSYSAVIGLRADWMRNLLLILLALAVVTGIQAVGVILVVALLVTPSAAASLITNNLPRMMLLSALFIISSGVIGLYASMHIDKLNAGAAIVLACTGWFAIVFIGRSILHGFRARG